MRYSTGLFGIAAWLLSALPAYAADGPVLAPTRDVAVIYKLSGSSQMQGSQKLQVTYGERGRVRMDFFRFTEAKYPFASLLFDPPSDRVMTLLPERHGYLERDVDHLPNPGAFLSDKMTFAQLGKATIADVACTDWHVTNGANFDGTACVTDDGVVLRATRTKPLIGEMLATTVQYATPPADVFEPPAGFDLIPSEPARNPNPPPLAAKPK